MEVELAAKQNFDRSVKRFIRKWRSRIHSSRKSAAKGDIEAVHDMRTATRRLRTLLKLIDGKRAKRLQRKTKKIADALGRVRDLDVAIERIESDLDPEGYGFKASAIETWCEEIRLERADALRNLRRVLRSDVYADWRPAVKRFAEKEGSGEMKLAGRVHEALPTALREGLSKCESHFPPMGEMERHELRKSIKRLRYLLSFYDELVPNSEPVLAKLERAQDALGESRDRIVLADRAERQAEAAATMGEEAGPLREYAESLRSGQHPGEAVRIASHALDAARDLIAPESSGAPAR